MQLPQKAKDLKNYIIFDLAREAYGSDVWPNSFKEARAHTCGDTLADFIVLELGEAVDWDNPDYSQADFVESAFHSMDVARRQISDVANKIASYFDEVARPNEVAEYYTKNSELSSAQVNEIREGLEAGLDVSVYARPEFDWVQMNEIRKGLKAGLDVSVYAKPEFTPEQMAISLKALSDAAKGNPEQKAQTRRTTITPGM